jgi:hypothetical protein
MGFMVLTRWATVDLRHGDLTALAEIAKGWGQPTDTCIARLKRRGSSRQGVMVKFA